MKAVLHYKASPGFRERLNRLASSDLHIEVVGESETERFRTAMQDADILLHVLEPLSAEHIANAPRLRLIQKIGVGVNTIDLEAARAQGVAVANMPGSNAQAVAELTILLALAALRRLPALDSSLRAGRGWPPVPETVDALSELSGRTIGLVGFGDIASRVARMAAAFGARVVYTARSRKPEAEAEWRGFPGLLAESDVVSLHLPETDETRGLIDAQAMDMMRPGAVLINTARGGLVEETALVARLRDGRLRAAGLDVFAMEPVDPDNPLLHLDNVALTPHVGWLTVETLDRSIAVIAENCRRLAAGEPILNRVV